MTEGKKPLRKKNKGMPKELMPKFDGTIKNPVDERGKVNTEVQIRKRLRRSADPADIDALMKLKGQRPVAEWDFEELLRGKPKNSEGKFSSGSGTGKWLTPVVQAEIKRRIPELTLTRINGLIPLSLMALKKLITDDTLDDNGKPIIPASVRLQALTYVLDQAVGKAKQKVEVEGNNVLQVFLAGALVLDDGAPAHPIIEGTVLHDDDNEQEDFDDDDDD